MDGNNNLNNIELLQLGQKTNFIQKHWFLNFRAF